MEENILVLQLVGHLELALALIVVGLEVENRAVLDQPAGVRALVNRLLQDAGFPALHEVTVVAVARWVAVGQHELAVHVLERVGVPDGLVEEGDEAVLVAVGAGSVHDQRRIGDVGFVIGRVGILAVPARREHDLKANTIGAEGVQVGLLWQVVAVQRRLTGEVVVQAIEANGLLAQRSLGTLITEPERLGRIGHRPGEVALEGITSNHTEVGRESLDLFAVKEIVTATVRRVDGDRWGKLTRACRPPLVPSPPYRWSA